jgi:D-alanyl-D-alanine carboxypeptidase
MAGLDGIAPALASAFMQVQAAARQAGFNIGISSGFRSPEEQARLRRQHCCNDPGSSKCGCGPPTAPPGKSNHQHGLAIDISGSKAAKAWVNAHGAQFGVHFPVAGEDWHMELIGGGEHGGHAQGAFQMGGLNPDLDFLGQPAMTPEERQDQAIQTYMDVIVGAQRDELLATPTDDALATPASTAPELGPQGLGESFTPEGMQEEQLRTIETTMPGQPQAGGGAGAGGQWGGGGALPPPGYVPPGKGADRWRGVMEAAMRYAGINPTPELVALGLRRLAQESGGDPMAVNNWDINAKRGDPSKGLMQNIGSAFPERAKELSGRGIFDGFANIVASIRYTLGRYGSLERGWGRSGGY